ncbi:MAG: hypothetical protein HC809_04510, partial [Gammaproteobacteria bacterium]|nr:hypothetical protein [Gammaproteobacteria bacterium]
MLRLGSVPVWESPECFEVNRLPMRTSFTHFADAQSARDGESTCTLTLAPQWRFALVGSPDAAASGFEKPDFDDADWDLIDVPGNWTRQGYDKPHYTNVIMPFALDPPQAPAANPTGLYRTWFTLPAALRTKRMVLSVGGAESVLLIYVNGAFVGLSKDSRLPAEFDVTAHLKRGRNLIAAMVIRWSDASYLEDQDHWWMAGIHRGVHLYATSASYLADVRVAADWDGSAGDLALEVDVGGAIEAGLMVRAQLETLSSRRIGRVLAGPVPAFRDHSPRAQMVSAVMFDGNTVRLGARYGRVTPWHHERPTCYRVV